MKPEDLTGMMKRVAEMCQAIPECKSNDRRLIWELWTKQLGFPPGGMASIRWTEFNNKLYSPETIRRSRQKLQEEGLCLPPEKVSEKRQELAQEIRTKPPIMDYKNKNQYRMF